MEEAKPAVCRSPAMAGLLARLDRLAVMDQKTTNPCNVLIQGETGTGKDLIARRIHENSGRAEAPVVAVNCSAMPAELFESELFGHEKGAFTGAYAQKRGLLEQAFGGTLFLDEVADLPVKLQVKLLRVLQHKMIRRVGGLKDIEVNVRVIAASNRDLVDLAKTGLFRSDLLYRLSVFPVTVPPLRERREDIPVLAEHFCDGFAAKYGVPRKQISAEASEALLGHPWPGNVRELEHTIEYAYVASIGDEINMEDLTPKLGSAVPAENAPVPAGTNGAAILSTGHAREELRRWLMSLPEEMPMRTLVSLFREAKGWLCEKRRDDFGGNISRAARSLGLDRSSFSRMANAYGSGSAKEEADEESAAAPHTHDH